MCVVEGSQDGVGGAPCVLKMAHTLLVKLQCLGQPSVAYPLCLEIPWALEGAVGVVDSCTGTADNADNAGIVGTVDIAGTVGSTLHST